MKCIYVYLPLVPVEIDVIRVFLDICYLCLNPLYP